jgi:hypothetical protein
MPGKESLRITWVSAKEAVPVPALFAVIVQLKDVFWTTLPPTLLDLLTVNSAI